MGLYNQYIYNKQNGKLIQASWPLRRRDPYAMAAPAWPYIDIKSKITKQGKIFNKKKKASKNLSCSYS